MKYNLKKYTLHHKTNNMSLIPRCRKIDFIFNYLKRKDPTEPIKYRVYFTDKKEREIEVSIALMRRKTIVQVKPDLERTIDDVKTIIYSSDEDYENPMSLSKFKIKLCKLIDSPMQVFENKKDIKQIDELEYLETFSKISSDSFRRLLLEKHIIEYEKEAMNFEDSLVEKFISDGDYHKLLLQYLTQCSEHVDNSKNIFKHLSTFKKKR